MRSRNPRLRVRTTLARDRGGKRKQYRKCPASRFLDSSRLQALLSFSSITSHCIRGSFLFSQTVILDNCHSGSGTRDPCYLTRGVRYRSGSVPGLVPTHEMRPATPPQIAQGSSSPIGGLGLTSSWIYPNRLTWSSVLFSACKSSELAKERGGRGLFTTALLQTMRRLRSDIWSITYKELFQNLPQVHL